jgi:hypothetical protein
VALVLRTRSGVGEVALALRTRSGVRVVLRPIPGTRVPSV